MTVSAAQYQAAASKLSSGVNEVSAKLNGFVSTTNSMLSQWYIPGFVKDAVKWLAEKLVSLAEAVWGKIVELMKGIAAPGYMIDYAWNWESVKETATGVASELSPQIVDISQDWKGQAATAYASAIAPQSAAAAQIGTIADKTAVSLGICAAAGVAFYVALGIIIFQLIASLVAATIAVGSIIFSWAGLGIVVADAGITTGLIIAAVTTLSACLAAQASQMVALHGSAADQTSFPGGQWPKATNLGG
jgi:uncharacterized protein YukE